MKRKLEELHELNMKLKNNNNYGLWATIEVE